jgi:Na+/proline symporter
MSPALLFSFVIGYFIILLGVAWLTSRNSNNDSFYIGNRSSNWMLVAFGMIGTSLSGVTFVSVPGGVARESFAYFQISLGYLIGYIVIAYVLLPLYYRMNLTSIYNYLDTRLGFRAYKTGASFFILSRTLGATARLYLVVKILQDVILTSFGVPFWLSTLVILLMILLYTFEGGVKTIVYTDTLQTTCMLAGLVICVFFILQKMDMGIAPALSQMNENNFSKIFFTDPGSKLFFLKQIMAGAFISFTMTGMDQEMMQKTISVKTLKDSQKNIISMAVVMLGVILLFLFLGGLLHLYAFKVGAHWETLVQNGKSVTKLILDGKDVTADKLFPAIAIGYMPKFFGVIFIVALISALFPSADGAITALTSSFSLDILGLNRRTDLQDATKKRIRQTVHLAFAALFLVLVLVFKELDKPSMIGIILAIAPFTYGPILGLFMFGILSKRSVVDKFTPIVCISSTVICYIIDNNQASWFPGFTIGPEMLVLNGMLTYLGLWFISKPKELSLQKQA